MIKANVVTEFLKQTHYHFSWETALVDGLQNMSSDYLKTLLKEPDWLPGIHNLFNAFSLPKYSTRYILLGESPYPRSQSANGYAFWDQAVTELWSETGLSKGVNRATSLRNFIKMLLVASGDLSINNTKPEAISNIDKTKLIQTNRALFQKLLSEGFLLLNASLTLENSSVSFSSQHWLPFLRIVFGALAHNTSPRTLILLGNIAKKTASQLNLEGFSILTAEHPYNLSFISNQDVIKLFKPFQLLSKKAGAT